MKRLLFAVTALAVFGSSTFAQQPDADSGAQGKPDKDNQQVSLTPEMLLYLQAMRRHDDPRQAVRRNAERKAAERRARLSAMQWFGYSNQRPQAAPTPFMGTYSPVWTGNSWDPYRWVGVGSPYMTYRLDFVPRQY